MTNPHKGDVSLVVSDRLYTLRYSHLALVKLENKLDKSVVEIMTEIQNAKENIRIGTLVALLWAGLQKHHPGLSYEDAADLLDDVNGGAAAAIEVIGEAFEKAFSAPGTKGTHPPQKAAQNGIGTDSLSSSSALVTTPQSSG